MSVTRDRQRLPVAALLLGLIAAFALCPPDYVRTQNRSRTSRAVRLDDHDHDHALDAEALACDLSNVYSGASPDHVAALPLAPKPPDRARIRSGSDETASALKLQQFPYVVWGRPPPVCL